MTTVVIYAALYWRSEFSGYHTDVKAEAVAAAAKLRRASYESLLAKKDAEIFNVSKMLWDLVERHPSLADSNDIAFLTTSNLSHVSRSHGRQLGVGGVLLNLNGDSIRLQPRMTVGYKKRQALLVLGISHVRRPKESYLMATLQSLVSSMKQQDTEKTVIVVQVSDPWNVSYYLDVCRQIRSEFASHVVSGLIEIILPPEHFYPDLNLVLQRMGDAAQETRWRTKQSLDYVFLMAYSARRGKYYVQLEDDVVAAQDCVATMLDYVEKQPSGWLMVDFSSLGFVGKLFHSETLAALIQFIALFYEHKPVDVLLFNYFYVRECFTNVLVGEAPVSEKDCPDMARVVRTLQPALFQHIGVESSHGGKVLSNTLWNPAQQNAPTAPKVISHRNPPAVVTTSLKQYQDFSVGNCYSGISAFWALNPQPDDFILISFVTPASIKRYRFLTGDQQHTSDKAFGATVEVLTSSREPSHNQTTIGNYQVISKFNESVVIDGTTLSLADGVVPSELSPVLALRVSFHVASQNWLLLTEVLIELSA